jgi:hypothetical protein
VSCGNLPVENVSFSTIFSYFATSSDEKEKLSEVVPMFSLSSRAAKRGSNDLELAVVKEEINQRKK